LKALHTELEDRLLRFDGTSEVAPEQLAKFLLLGVPPASLRVHEETEEVARFNAQVLDSEVIKTSSAEPIVLKMGWNLPDFYKELDLDQYFGELFEAKFGDNIDEVRLQRMSDELYEVKTRGMVEFMRTIIFILDTFREKGIVWGVGRGSSCASYLLYLIGLHAVDSVAFDVPMSEFFHD
jgi:DNA polymerase III alpha subunit